MNHCCPAGRKTLDLLKTARGQLDNVIAMVEGDRYCIDIAKQVLAVSALLKKANHEVIHNHMRTCVVEALHSDNSALHDEKIEEIMLLLRSYLAKD